MRKYKGVSLVEMLITIVILSVIMILTTTTLTTLIKVSAAANGRSMSRDDSEFVIELIRRSVRNSYADDVYIYNVSGRTYDTTTKKIVSENVSGYTTPVAQGAVGNEIHFRPTGYSRWICIAYFPTETDASIGYIVKSSTVDNATPSSCFDSTNPQYLQYAMVLNSDDVYAEFLNFQMYKTAENNLRVISSIKMKPALMPKKMGNITPEYFKQALITSEKLTWE
ncbi:prepilin-type N-terminal cleavage/methylation domain-containing protein [Candidatus Dojkabacteria bacterium]|nr:prepilin-type N-terminal cleavage/methylation domain-containing protein [Candidatus Dojkabacteria bacterium]